MAYQQHGGSGLPYSYQCIEAMPALELIDTRDRLVRTRREEADAIKKASK